MIEEVVVSLKNVSKTYTLYENNADSIFRKVLHVFKPKSKRKLKVLSNVSLEIKKGDFLGVLGKNGSGKSTLLNIMCGAIPPDKGGEVVRKGSYIRLALGMGFNPELSTRQNTYLNASVLGLSIKKIDEVFNDIIAFAELEKFIHTPLKYYSTGMRSRLAFAIAVYANADIFLMDEFFGGVGDEQFKKKSQQVFEDNMLKGRTVVHVSHSLQNILKHCNKVIIVHEGKIIGPLETKEGVERYQSLLS